MAPRPVPCETAGGHGAEALLANLPEERPVRAARARRAAMAPERRRPQRVARQTGDRRRGGALAADVADRDRPRAVTGLEGVVEVPADLRALAGRVIDRGDLGVRDVGERWRQKRALKRPRDLISVLVEAGGVDGGCGSPGELDREREVRLVVAPVGAPRWRA